VAHSDLLIFQDDDDGRHTAVPYRTVKKGKHFISAQHSIRNLSFTAISCFIIKSNNYTAVHILNLGNNELHLKAIHKDGHVATKAYTTSSLLI
jgi:hypothetical protein